jgi:hypothetical protein
LCSIAGQFAKNVLRHALSRASSSATEVEALRGAEPLRALPQHAEPPAADVAEIERWGERVLGAKTLADVLDESS